MPTGHPPLGYGTETRNDKKGFVTIDENTGQKVARAFLLRLEGLSYLEIGTEVDLHLSRKTWSDILRNPAYKGVYVFSGAEYHNVIPALVSDAIWQQVQNTLCTLPVRAWARKTPYLLSGLLRCHNGHTMAGTRYKRDNETIRVYRCLTRMQYGTDTCDAQSAKCEMLDQLVIKQVLLDLEDTDTMLNMLYKQYEVDRVALELRDSAQRITEISAAIGRLVELADVGETTTEEVKRRLVLHEQELSFHHRLQASLTEQVPEALTWDRAALHAVLLSMRGGILGGEKAAIRAALRELVSSVDFVNTRATVNYRLPSSKIAG